MTITPVIVTEDLPMIFESQRTNWLAAAAIVLTPLLFFALIWWITSKFIEPVPLPVVWPLGLAAVKQDVTFDSRDQVALKGWFLPAPNADEAVVLLHSISMTRTDMLDRGLWLRSLGYNVLVYDARGCGESEPVFRSFGWSERQDLLGALDWLQARGMNQVACIGFSQGAATIVMAGPQLPECVHAIVIEGCYTDLRRSAHAHIRHWAGPLAPFFQATVVPVLQWRLGWKLNSVSPLKEIGKIDIPTYFIGGANDDRATPDGMLELYQAAPKAEGFWLVPSASHDDFYAADPAGYRHRIGAFIQANMPVDTPVRLPESNPAARGAISASVASAK